MALSIFTKHISIFSNTRNTNWNGNDIFGALLSMTIVRRLNVFDQNHQNLSCNFPASWRAARLILTLISYLFRMSVLSLRTLSSLECVLSLGSQFSAWCVLQLRFAHTGPRALLRIFTDARIDALRHRRMFISYATKLLKCRFALFNVKFLRFCKQ